MELFCCCPFDIRRFFRTRTKALGNEKPPAKRQPQLDINEPDVTDSQTQTQFCQIEEIKNNLTNNQNLNENDDETLSKTHNIHHEQCFDSNSTKEDVTENQTQNVDYEKYVNSLGLENDTNEDSIYFYNYEDIKEAKTINQEEESMHEVSVCKQAETPHDCDLPNSTIINTECSSPSLTLSNVLTSRHQNESQDILALSQITEKHDARDSVEKLITINKTDVLPSTAEKLTTEIATSHVDKDKIFYIIFIYVTIFIEAVILFSIIFYLERMFS